MLNFKNRPLRILFRAAAGLTALGVAAGIASNVGNMVVSANAPTPLEFAKRNGRTYQPETQRALREFDDVRVIESGTRSHKLYCAVNFIVCNHTEESGFGDIYSFVPTPLTRALGMSPVVFLKSANDNLHGYLLKHTTGQSVAADLEKSAYAFDFSIFHELGHIWTAKIQGNQAYYEAPVPRRELGADRFTIPHLEREHGSKGSAYLYHFRALTQTDWDHDIILPLLRPANAPGGTGFAATGNEEKDFDTHLSFSSLFKTACTAPKAKISMPDRFQQFYTCLRQNGISAEAGTGPNPDMEIRTSSYVAAYEYFFPASRP